MARVAARSCDPFRDNQRFSSAGQRDLRSESTQPAAAAETAERRSIMTDARQTSFEVPAQMREGAE
jgi:hypothetical protein